MDEKENAPTVEVKAVDTDCDSDDEAYPPCPACDEMLESNREGQGTLLDHTCGYTG